MSQFLNSNEITIQNGYLSALVKGAKKPTPIFNADFVSAQEKAEYIVLFAKCAANKNFTSRRADSVEDVRREVANMLAAKATVYVTAPEKAVTPVTDSLAKEALAFMDFHEGSSRIKKVNDFMQQFQVLTDLEDNGLFFTETQVVKMNKIYSVKDILTAVNSCIDLLA